MLWPSDEGELVTQMYFDVDDLQILDRCIEFSQAADDDSFVRNGIEVFRLTEGRTGGSTCGSGAIQTGEFGVQVKEGPIAEALVDGLSFRSIGR